MSTSEFDGTSVEDYQTENLIDVSSTAWMAGLTLHFGIFGNT